MTLVTLVLLTLFVGLGRWQWQRGELKAEQWRGFEAAPAPVLTENPPDFDRLPRYTRMAFHCRIDGEHQFLLENRTHAGRPGYEVLTPCATTNDRHILVNRGWIPFEGRRDQLPDIAVTAEGRLVVSGRLDELPVAGLPSGRAPPDATGGWPRVTTFPTHEELQTALGRPIARRILLLDPQISGIGFVREWSPPGLAPDRHFSYAIQWWGFALVLLVLYFALNSRKVE